jgi:hypothetical protein
MKNRLMSRFDTKLTVGTPKFVPVRLNGIWLILRVFGMPVRGRKIEIMHKNACILTTGNRYVYR